MQMEVGHDSPILYRDRIPTSLSLNGSHHGINTEFTRETKSFQNGFVHSSPDTSGASSPAPESPMENEFSSAEEMQDDHDVECDSYIKDYVAWLFDPEQDISYENKAKFGEMMKDVSARMSFAKYIDAQRSNAKCVDETTFYKLVHSFALVLFECGEADDYMPGKSLMNMAFTYYYIPDQRMVSADAFSSGESLSSSSTSGGERSGQRSKSDSDNIQPVKKKSFMQKFKKDLEACKQIFQETPSFQELKQGFWHRKLRSSTSADENPQSLSRSVSAGEEGTRTYPELVSPTTKPTKNYLYEHLKNQVIWKSLRFWNAAFFSAVHAERKRRCTQKYWTDLSPDEQESANESIVNITFGQLGTFINNMKCIGLDNKTCLEFLRKQSIIGGIEEGGQYYKMLIEQIEDDCTF